MLETNDLNKKVKGKDYYEVYTWEGSVLTFNSKNHSKVKNIAPNNSEITKNIQHIQNFLKLTPEQMNVPLRYD